MEFISKDRETGELAWVHETRQLLNYRSIAIHSASSTIVVADDQSGALFSFDAETGMQIGQAERCYGVATPRGLEIDSEGKKILLSFRVRGRLSCQFAGFPFTRDLSSHTMMEQTDQFFQTHIPPPVSLTVSGYLPRVNALDVNQMIFVQLVQKQPPVGSCGPKNIANWAYIHSIHISGGVMSLDADRPAVAIKAPTYQPPTSVAIANDGRVLIVGNDNRIHAFSRTGEHLSIYVLNRRTRDFCDLEIISSVAFDKFRGQIIYTTSRKVFAIRANSWLPQTLRSDIISYDCGSYLLRRQMHAIFLLRNAVQESALSLLPNELLFEIFNVLLAIEIQTARA